MERVATWVENLRPTPLGPATARTAWSDGERQELRRILRRESASTAREALDRPLAADLVLQLLGR